MTETDAHSLRNLLHVAKGNIELLLLDRDGRLEPGQRRYLNTALRSVNDAIHLVEIEARP